MVGLGGQDGNPLESYHHHHREENDAGFRRLDGATFLFPTCDEEDAPSDVGLFKAQKGAPEVSTPVTADHMELMSPLALPVPVCEDDGLEGSALSVYHKPTISHHMQESTITATEEENDNAVEVQCNISREIRDVSVFLHSVFFFLPLFFLLFSLSSFFLFHFFFRSLFLLSFFLSLFLFQEVDYEYVYMEGENWEKVQWVGGGASGSCYVAMDRSTNSVILVKQVRIVG